MRVEDETRKYSVDKQKLSNERSGLWLNDFEAYLAKMHEGEFCSVRRLTN
jgi:hypothetical protein